MVDGESLIISSSIKNLYVSNYTLGVDMYKVNNKLLHTDHFGPVQKKLSLLVSVGQEPAS